ncbi:MAG: pyridoxal phosphate-dependent aminotransferase [Candidatus Latescibacteria bacterium]|jgi:aspartate aminotransferase|nr:pyridoxal phosphate-dependent aminotransferase [Candidatus Latescibacterota bacterium]
MAGASFSKRVMGVEESITVATTARAGALQREGVDVISMSSGEPDFDTPQNIKDAAIRAIHEGHTKYTRPATGILELKEAICRKLSRDNGLEYDPTQVVVGCGAKQTVFDAVVSLIEDGDEAVIPAPFWNSYADQVKLMGGNPVIVQTRAEDGFRLTPAQLEAAITERTKFLLLNSPCNPSGEVYTRDELSALGEIVLRAGIGVISDEVYEKIIYGDSEHVSIASLDPALKEQTLVVNGVSKAYAMTGWRVGYGAGPADLISMVGKIQSQETTHTCSISQHAAAEALDGPQESVEMMRRAFEERRDVIVEGLNAIPGISCRKPRGAFYVFPDVSALIEQSRPSLGIRNDVDLCNYLLDEARVAAVPGTGFGTEGHIRIAYATAMDLIRKALDRISEAAGKMA